MSSFEEVASVLATAADSVHEGQVVQVADELRECLRFLSAAGQPAMDAFGAQVQQYAADLDELAARLLELRDGLVAAAQRVAAGGAVAG